MIVRKRTDLAEPLLALTFDDGPPEALEIVVPALTARGLAPVTVSDLF